MNKIDKWVFKTPRALLPIIKPVKVKEYSETATEWTQYMLRLSPLERYTSKEVLVWLKTFTEAWTLGTEKSTKEKLHFHITIYSSLEESELRKKINDFLNIQFPEPQKRGDANKRYNLTLASSVEKAVSYSIKDGDFLYGDDINPEFILECKKASFQKFDKVTMAQQIEDLKSVYKTTDMTMGEFMIQFVQLKAMYRQPINLNYIYQLALSCRVNKEPQYAEQLVSDYLIKVSKYQ